MAKVRKRTLPSGEVRWLADYFDAGGNRRSKQFDKRKDADAYLVKVRRDLQLGIHVTDSASITIKEAAKLWLERCDAKGLERSTRTAYAEHVNIHIMPLIGARKLSQFNTPHVHAFADELAKDRSPAMVKRIVRSLGAIFVEARRRGLAATNPVSDAKVKTNDRRKSKRPEIPTKAELRTNPRRHPHPRQAPRTDRHCPVQRLACLRVARPKMERCRPQARRSDCERPGRCTGRFRAAEDIGWRARRAVGADGNQRAEAAAPLRRERSRWLGVSFRRGNAA
ncbi:MAG: hypothetical protein EOR81_21755 [Mesorhizobium sp.]|nr:MAG: hypothetical protein EOR81_21755 [Mesorhizobium sp.]